MSLIFSLFFVRHDKFKKLLLKGSIERFNNYLESKQTEVLKSYWFFYLLAGEYLLVAIFASGLQVSNLLSMNTIPSKVQIEFAVFWIWITTLNTIVVVKLFSYLNNWIWQHSVKNREVGFILISIFAETGSKLRAIGSLIIIIALYAAAVLGGYASNPAYSHFSTSYQMNLLSLISIIVTLGFCCFSGRGTS